MLALCHVHNYQCICQVFNAKMLTVTINYIVYSNPNELYHLLKIVYCDYFINNKSHLSIHCYCNIIHILL